MKTLILIFSMIQFAHAGDSGVTGTVQTVSGCSKKVMVWLSLDKDLYKERLLLMHTEVPVGGDFQFYLKPGKYQVHASDQQGCEFFKRIEVKRSVASIEIKMVKK